MIKIENKRLFVLFFLGLLVCCGQEGLSQSTYSAANIKNDILSEWESLRFGAFVHFNDNTFLEKEISRNSDTGIFNPVTIDFDGMMVVFHDAGVRYAVLTARHTSGFCLWDSKVTKFDVGSSLYKKDIIRIFVDACLKYNIKPCLYYCLWGNKSWNPADWNSIIRDELKSITPKSVILAQLTEMAENYGSIFEFWLDMQCWADTTLKPQEIYDLLKCKNPKTIVHFNQQVQNGTTIKYFPTDIVNGEERVPPVTGHKSSYTISGTSYYLPFEYEITSQQCDQRSLGHGLMDGSVWFTYRDSHFYPVDSLYRYIKNSYDLGGSNILLSTAPDKTGAYKKADADSLIKLGKLIWSDKKP
jgi:alpha-L-fucosidase